MLIEFAQLSRDQRRKRKLVEREKRRPKPSIPVAPMLLGLDRDKIAETVHRAVCQFTRGDGYGRCAYYTYAGAALLTYLTKEQWLVQGGTLKLWCDADEQGPLGLAMDASLGGIEGNEFHSWIVGPIRPHHHKPGRHELAGDLNIVDFSSRHFKRHVEDIAGRAAGPEGIVVRWNLPEPPAYIWTTKKPDWYTVQAEEQASNRLWANSGHFRPLMRLVIQCWKA